MSVIGSSLGRRSSPQRSLAGMDDDREAAEEIRKAASLVVAREGVAGPEILVLERGASSRFLPGYIAFPGGAVDESDKLLAMKWFGDAVEADRAASVRELLEEAGLALTSDGLVEADSLERVDQAPPAASQLRELAHWVAPEQVPVRFDARFFAAASPAGLTPTPDGGETAAAWWAAPKALLEEWESGDRLLYWPTYFTMRKLADCSTASELLALWFETREPTDDEMTELPRSVFEQG
jgi:8-oxo-dGTP pyrophosphatase MutT (NUDIX family)